MPKARFCFLDLTKQVPQVAAVGKLLFSMSRASRNLGAAFISASPVSTEWLPMATCSHQRAGLDTSTRLGLCCSWHSKIDIPVHWFYYFTLSKHWKDFKDSFFFLVLFHISHSLYVQVPVYNTCYQLINWKSRANLQKPITAWQLKKN